MSRGGCSCGIISSTSVDQFRHNNLVGILTPKLALGGQILQASLSIAPAAHHSIHYRAGSRYSMINLTDRENNNTKCRNNHNNCQMACDDRTGMGNLVAATAIMKTPPTITKNGLRHVDNATVDDNDERHVIGVEGQLGRLRVDSIGGGDGDREREVVSPSAFAFQARHSKSLDQLECQFEDAPRSANSQAYNNNYVMPLAPLATPTTSGRGTTTTPSLNNAELMVRSLPRKSTSSAVPPPSTTMEDTKLIKELRKDETEDLLRNINEFREKYKNAAAEFPIKSNLANGCYESLAVAATVAGDDQPATLDSELAPRRKYAPKQYFNSLPKGSSGGLKRRPMKLNLSIKPQTTGPAIVGGTKTELEQEAAKQLNGNCNTIPRCHSTNVLRIRKMRRYARTRSSGEKIKYNSHSRLVRKAKRSDDDEGRDTGVNSRDSSSSSSSGECTTSAMDRRKERRLLSSASVPFKLEDLEKIHRRSKRKISYKNSESLPNLAPPPPGFESSSPFFLPRLHKAVSSSSTSSLSDQSGWVSSRRSSIGQASSPETMRNEKILNGQQLRNRLRHLLREDPRRTKKQDQEEEKMSVKRTSVTVR